VTAAQPHSHSRPASSSRRLRLLSSIHGKMQILRTFFFINGVACHMLCSAHTFAPDGVQVGLRLVGADLRGAALLLQLGAPRRRLPQLPAICSQGSP